MQWIYRPLILLSFLIFTSIATGQPPSSAPSPPSKPRYDLVVCTGNKQGDGYHAAIYRIVLEKEAAKPILVDRDIYDIACSRSGRLLYSQRKTEGWWWWMDVEQPETKHKLSGLPDTVEYWALAKDGSQLAWIAGRKPAILTLRDLGSGQTRTLTLGNGMPGACSWSPNKRYLCYYFYSSEKDEAFAFSLHLVDLTRDPLQDQVLAPPSLMSYLDARQTPPEWKPDSSQVIFQAEYDNRQFKTAPNDPPYLDLFTVSVSGKDLAPATSSTTGWLDDGQHKVKSSEWKTNPQGEAPCTTIITDLKSQKDQTYRYVIPANSSESKWAPDGSQLALTRLVDHRSRIITVIDLATGRSRDVLTLPEEGWIRTFYWVERSTSKPPTGRN